MTCACVKSHIIVCKISLLDPQRLTDAVIFHTMHSNIILVCVFYGYTKQPVFALLLLLYDFKVTVNINKGTNIIKTYFGT